LAFVDFILDGLSIKIRTESIDYLRSVRSYFTETVKVYSQFIGQTEKEVSFFDLYKRSIPYGLFSDLYQYHKQHFPNISFSIDPAIIQFYKGEDIDPIFDLKYKPHDYQEASIKKALKRSKALIRISMGGGKTIVVSYICRILYKPDRQQIVVVPTLDLLEQTYDKMIEYGIDENLLGKISRNYDQEDKPIIVSTWQTLKKKDKLLKNVYGIYVDEAHLGKGETIRNRILKKCKNARYRIGLTGTLPKNIVDQWYVQSFLGPKIVDIPAGWLIKNGYLSDCNIVIANIDYKENYWGSYDEVKERIFTNPFRMSVITDIIKKRVLSDNILIFVGFKEREGIPLLAYLQEQFPEKKVMFISGDDKVEVRKKSIESLMNEDNVIVIATFNIFQLGIDAPALSHVMLASSYSSSIRILQSIGRPLRLYKDKKATIYDISDNVMYLKKHKRIREQYYQEEEFNVSEIDFEEK
jgi:superfamily II DNA or RNA helicase